MNEKGETTVFMALALTALASMMFLCALELERSFKKLRSRTWLFLCTKEAKGELHLHLKLMGRSNWALKNLERSKWVMALIPGLQGAALNTNRAKKFIALYQDTNLLLYLARLKKIANKGCPLDPRMYLSPYELNGTGHLRHFDGSAKQRSKKWAYYFVQLPFALELEVEAERMEKPRPDISYRAREKGAKLSSLWSFAY